MNHSIQAGEVHIWSVDMDDCGWDAFGSVLSADEREKAQRFRAPNLRQHYQRNRSALRLLLSHYLSRHAAQIEFLYNQFGKPGTVGQLVHFNLSHSNRYAMIAIAAQPVGVDLEFMDRQKTDIHELVEWACHPLEKAALHLLPAAEQALYFYRLWTQKEAYCKVLGIGLNHALPALRFEAARDAAGCLVVDENGASAAPFFVHRVPCPDGYAASVCLSRDDARISLFSATPEDHIFQSTEAHQARIY
ncbi:4'-phosphopantetheinyl transferase family protein [Paraherbaspirillum soli]|uniref:4'-phosphopantetheinyl transferase family protein n=1 Tax=Paraherbaspirillum soli TaxID=631222 RepID=A0ABW0MH00_9BURK